MEWDRDQAASGDVLCAARASSCCFLALASGLGCDFQEQFEGGLGPISWRFCPELSLQGHLQWVCAVLGSAAVAERTILSLLLMCSNVQLLSQPSLEGLD
ncbi:hypothetical protein H8959_018983 [Pygathrix nigripes]